MKTEGPMENEEKKKKKSEPARERKGDKKTILL